MSYIIRSYEESFVEKQAEIGRVATDSWIGYNMASADAIRNTYSQENFDPDTRLYAFKDDEMVGFLTGHIFDNPEGVKEANYRFPILKAEHEEAAKPLIDRSFEVLKAKGVTKIRTSVKADWGNFKQYAEDYGFKYERVATTFALLKVSDLKLPEENSEFEIEELDLEKHESALINIFQTGFGLDEEAAKNNFELIKSFDQNLIVTHSAVFKDGEIVARALLYLPNLGSEEAFLGNIYAPEGEEEKYYDVFMKHLVEASSEKGVSVINKPILGDKLKVHNYEKYGFAFDNVVDYYTIDLE